MRKRNWKREENCLWFSLASAESTQDWTSAVQCSRPSSAANELWVSKSRSTSFPLFQNWSSAKTWTTMVTHSYLFGQGTICTVKRCLLNANLVLHHQEGYFKIPSPSKRHRTGNLQTVLLKVYYTAYIDIEAISFQLFLFNEMTTHTEIKNSPSF